MAPSTSEFFVDEKARPLLEIAQMAARSGAEVLRRRREIGIGAADVRGRDIKLAEDKLSEAAIIASLRAASSYPILAEESGWVPNEAVTADAIYWAIDPLDGTFNYFRGIPLCCTAVALCMGMKPILGAVFDFNRDEMFAGGKGVGFFVNEDAVIRPSGSHEILTTGFPVRGHHGTEALEKLSSLESKWRKVRMLGSAALSLAWLAAGRVDGYEEQGIMWWDVAAGCALVEAAGGSVTITGSSVQNPVDVCAIGSIG